jgi:hypothetical protein
MLTIITIKWRSLSQWWADHSLYEIEVRWGGGEGGGGVILLADSITVEWIQRVYQRTSYIVSSLFLILLILKF